jgi:hypothetical protein
MYDSAPPRLRPLPNTSTSAMPPTPVYPNDVRWATGKTTTSSHLFRPAMTYDPALPSLGIVPNTSIPLGYVPYPRQSLAPFVPSSNGGSAFFVAGSAANQAAMYNLVNTSPVSTGRAQPMPPPTFYQNQIPPGRTRSNLLQIPGTAHSGMTNLSSPGRGKFNIMDVFPPATPRSSAQALPTQSQIMLAGMLTPQGQYPR